MNSMLSRSLILFIFVAVFFTFSFDDFRMCFSNDHINNFRMFDNDSGQGI